jgi:hypothetical protein
MFGFFFLVLLIVLGVIAARYFLARGRSHVRDAEGRRIGPGADDVARTAAIVGGGVIVLIALLTSFRQYGWSTSSLTLVGVKTDAKTGEMSVDSAKFQKALATKFDDVTRLFTAYGYSDNGAVSYGRSFRTTTAGIYTIEETDVSHLRIQLKGDSTWYSSDARDGDVLLFRFHS